MHTTYFLFIVAIALVIRALAVELCIKNSEFKNVEFKTSRFKTYQLKKKRPSFTSLQFAVFIDILYINRVPYLNHAPYINSSRRNPFGRKS